MFFIKCEKGYLMDKTIQDTLGNTEKSTNQQHEDAALKTCMQFFADELLPFFGIQGHVKAIAPTELVHLNISKLFQDFNLVMEDGTWKHFEFQSTNEGLDGLKRFRVYESITSYQNKVPVTTYVLFSGKIKKPTYFFSEGINTYQVVPIIMTGYNADEYISKLKEKVKSGKTLTKEDLVPLTMCLIMEGTMPQVERAKAAYMLTTAATNMDAEIIRKVQAVIYAMADKFLESDDLSELRKVVSMTRLGRMIADDAAYENKLKNARSLLGLLDEQIIAERIELPLEVVQGLKAEKNTNE